MLCCYGVSPENRTLTGHFLPHRINGKAIATDNALLIGDIAGLVDFWTGEGIFYAIKSAQLASKIIREFLHGRISSLKEYEKEVGQAIEPELKTSYQFSKIFNFLSCPAFKVIQKYDYPWDVFCRLCAMTGYF